MVATHFIDRCHGPLRFDGPSYDSLNTPVKLDSITDTENIGELIPILFYHAYGLLFFVNLFQDGTVYLLILHPGLLQTIQGYSRHRAGKRYNQPETVIYCGQNHHQTAAIERS